MAADGNLSLVLHGIDDMRLEERDIGAPSRGEVQLAMQAVGICGSDVHYWKHGRIGDFVVKAPMVLGHEGGGVVCAVGEGVTDLKVGDRVAIEPGVPCRTCTFCKTGRYNLCAEMKFCATPPFDGSLCRRYNHAADFCYKLPDHVSLEEAALLEPLSVGIHACHRAGITIGSNVLVCGADLDEGRLKKAKELGADFTIKVESRDGKEVAEKVMACLGPADQTVECTGAESSIHTGIYATKSGGVLVIVGMGKAEIILPIVNALVREVCKPGGTCVLVGSSSAACFEMPMFDARRREIDIRGVFRYSNCYPTALSMVASGAVDVKPLITHHFKLEESKEAFETSRTGAGGAIKVMIHCNK